MGEWGPSGGGGASGGAKVLGKLPVPSRRTKLDFSMARAYCTCSNNHQQYLTIHDIYASEQVSEAESL